MLEVLTHTLPNGLQLVMEPNPAVGSLAMSMRLPAGLAYEPVDQLGMAEMLAEIMCRGAGGKSAREHSDALDLLGVHRSTSSGLRHLSISATMIADKFEQAVPLLLDMATRPNLDESSLAPTRELALQAIAALQDDPQQRVINTLMQKHLPEPINRIATGEASHIQAMTIEDVRAFWDKGCRPGGAILGLAGRFDPSHIIEVLTQATENWQGETPDVVIADTPARGQYHETSDTTQTHIGLAYDAIPETDADSMLQKTAIAVLSGGMSGRLFTEVREKRGLCYAVYARYMGQRDLGTITAYAGTTTERAQETLDVMLTELERLSEGVMQDEFDRAIIGMKSRLVMQGESTSARSGAIASDYYHLGQARSLDELSAEVEAVRLDALNTFVAEHPMQTMTLSTIGQNALVVAK